MRDPERLHDFYNELKAIHMAYLPDWRFGQLCWNLFSWLALKEIDPFFTEEDKMLEYFREYVRGLINYEKLS